MFTRMFNQVLLEKCCIVTMMKEVEKGPSDKALQRSRNVHPIEVLVKRYRLNKAQGSGL